jgi:hypothetical protein
LLRFSREKRKVDLTTLWLIYSILWLIVLI